MSRTVYKYHLADTDREQQITLPAGATVIHFGRQERRFVVWVELDPDALPRVDYRFAIVGTGWDVPYGYRHVQSLIDGEYVWHLYQEAI